jgi:hypothetical protein
VSQSKPSDPGYRGALPPRNDWLARGWVAVVIMIFVLLFVLDILNVPTRLLPEPTPVPTPVVTPAPSGSSEPTESAAPSGSAPIESAAPSDSAEPSGTP